MVILGLKVVQTVEEEGILDSLSGGESGQSVGEDEQSEDKPTADVQGKDLPSVPRYPGSVRSMYGTIPGYPDAGFYIMYDAPGSAKEVMDFYEVQLPANGWESSLTVEAADEYNESYRFIDQALERGGQEIVVQVGLAGSDYAGYTDVTITFPSDPFKSSDSFK